MMKKATKNSLLECEPISPIIRMSRAIFNSKLAEMETTPQCCAPTDQLDGEKKQQCYQILQDQINNAQSHHILIVMEDMNGKVSIKKEGFESCMGQHAIGKGMKMEHTFWVYIGRKI